MNKVTFANKVSTFIEAETRKDEKLEKILAWTGDTPFVKKYIFGGSLRDMILGLAPGDLDIVVDENFELYCFERFCNKNQINCEPNSYNGITARTKNWKVDMWCAQKSWAFSKEGGCQWKDITSLLNTTITNWEAILFDLESKEIICKDFHAIENRRLRSVLAANMNPANATVKILRNCIRGKVDEMSASMANRIVNGILEEGTNALLEIEASKYFGKAVITNDICKRAVMQLQTGKLDYLQQRKIFNLADNEGPFWNLA